MNNFLKCNAVWRKSVTIIIKKLAASILKAENTPIKIHYEFLLTINLI